MRALKLLPMARRRCVMAAPATPSERLPDAASFYEPPHGGSDPAGAEERPWQSPTVTRIGPKE